MKANSCLHFLFVMLILNISANAQTYYKCKDGAGQFYFSDRPCAGAVAGVISPKPNEADSPERKAENDARIAREKSLADQLEATRVANEQAGYAAQAQQSQVSKEIATRVDQERSRQSSATGSTTSSSNAPTAPVLNPGPSVPVLRTY